MPRLTGVPVSPGLAVGKAALLMVHPLTVRRTIGDGGIEREWSRLTDAAAATRRQLGDIQERVRTRAGAELAGIFDAQLLMLDDRLLVPRACELVRDRRINAEWALELVLDEICGVLAEAGDEYLGERRGDIADVIGRVRHNMQAGGRSLRDVLAELPEGSVLVADDIPPSLAGQLDGRRVAGFVIEAGGRTHHSAILARSLGIPAVVGVVGVMQAVKPGDRVLVDGRQGVVLIDPDAVTAGGTAIAQALPRRAARQTGPCLTQDGVAITLEANVERPADAEEARWVGAEGIGLFRTEYLAGMQAVGRLDEERQFDAYRQIALAMAPLPVTIRTFDLDDAQAVGADDPGAGGAAQRAGGPLGMRALRLSLTQQPVFETQLRALVRAARHGRIRILFPFVTAVDELRRAKAILATVQAGCRAEDGANPTIPVGAMIEVPSAALTTDLLADEADFFSVGTNDLAQYCLAVDRTDGRVAAWYDPMHPALLRLIRVVVAAASRRGRPVSVCGEMASDPAAIGILLGLGVTRLSMGAAAIPAARETIATSSVRELRHGARRAMGMGRQRDGVASLGPQRGT